MRFISTLILYKLSKTGSAPHYDAIQTPRLHHAGKNGSSAFPALNPVVHLSAGFDMAVCGLAANQSARGSLSRSSKLDPGTQSPRSSRSAQ